MAFERIFEEVLDYQHCQYGASRLTFRGPAKDLSRPYVAVIGGSETYGKFVETPFSDVLEAKIGTPVVNLGCMRAGLTVFQEDDAVTEIASAARLTVVQVLGAQNMSNRFYTVHPRRNDRFLKPSAAMIDAFPGLDFMEFHFTGHLLRNLEAASHQNYEYLVEELRVAWVSRMKNYLQQIEGEKVLLWMSHRRPEQQSFAADGIDPLFVDRNMLDALAPEVSGLVEVVAKRSRTRSRLKGMVFQDMDQQAAAAMPGPKFHEMVASSLAKVVTPLLAAQKTPDTGQKKRRAVPSGAPSKTIRRTDPPGFKASRSTRGQR